jgi:hypothetical protein
MRSKIAEIEPPHDPPTKIAIKKPIAATAGKPIATGSNKIIPISGPRPGIAPTTSPTIMPVKVKISANGDEKTSNPAEKKSMIIRCLPWYKDSPNP